MAVLPFGRSGVISGAMLGLGRALGETMAVAIVLSASGAVTFNLISSAQPVDDRGEHRAAVPRVVRARGERADRLRPGPVRHHPAGQRRRPLDRQPPRASSRERTDDHRYRATTDERRARRAAPPSVAQPAASCRAGRRGRSSAASLVVVGGCSRLTGLGIGLAVVADRRRVRRGDVPDLARRRGPAQGHRPAGHDAGHGRVPDRDGPAGLGGRRPCSANGLARFDVEFFTYSMRGVVGEGGGGYHAIVGTLIITALAALISIPIGLLTADLPRGVRPRPAGAGDHVLRRRHDRHPVDRRRPVRLRAVRAVLRPGRPASGFTGSVALSRADDPGGGPLHRGDAQDRPERAARGGLRARRAEVAHDRQGRAPDRDRRHHHRHHARDRPRHRRDRAAADRGRASPRASTSTRSTGAWRRCRCSPTTPTSRPACRASRSSTAPGPRRSS